MNDIVGLCIHQEDKTFQTNCQLNAFLTRGDKVSAQTLLQTVRENIKIRHNYDVAIQRPSEILPDRILELNNLYKENFQKFLFENKLDFDSHFYDEVLKRFNQYIWKTAVLPINVKKIFVLGCGNGYELPYLRFFAPSADIVAIEFKQSISQQLIEKLDVQFFQDDAVTFLKEKIETFDVIFSNHVLEHFGNPETIFKLIFDALKTEGCVISAVPLDLDDTTPYSKALRHLCVNPEKLSLLDAAYLDLGHSWKTTYQDVGLILKSVGFKNVTLLQRNFSYANTKLTCREYESKSRRFDLLSNSLLIETPRKLAKLLFQNKVPRFFHRLFVYVDLSFWCGANRLKSSLAPELLLIGTKVNNEKI
jgi:SAM-dependent methyltransferase